MAFVKGQSGNPGGRPKIPEGEDVKVLARQFTQEAIITLADIATKGRGEVARVSAAVALLDRGWGRPAQEIQHTGEIDINTDAAFSDLATAMDGVARAVAGGVDLETAVASASSPVAGHA